MSEVLIGCPVVGNAKTLLKGKRKRKINPSRVWGEQSKKKWRFLGRDEMRSEGHPSRVGGTKGDETNRRSEG
jgi:hypothetical protein